MPNGRTGGFPIEVTTLQRLLGAIASEAVLGHVITGPRQRTPAKASDIARLVDQCQEERVGVEEQHGDSYIIHLADEPALVWVEVERESPLFQDLRQLHRQWTSVHPGWKGWIAF